MKFRFFSSVVLSRFPPLPPLPSPLLSITDFLSKCDQIRRKLPIWSYLLKKSLMENFIFLCGEWWDKTRETCHVLTRETCHVMSCSKIMTLSSTLRLLVVLKQSRNSIPGRCLYRPDKLTPDNLYIFINISSLFN